MEEGSITMENTRQIVTVMWVCLGIEVGFNLLSKIGYIWLQRNPKGRAFQTIFGETIEIKAITKLFGGLVNG